MSAFLSIPVCPRCHRTQVNLLISKRKANLWNIWPKYSWVNHQCVTENWRPRISFCSPNPGHMWGETWIIYWSSIPKPNRIEPDTFESTPKNQIDDPTWLNGETGAMNIHCAWIILGLLLFLRDLRRFYRPTWKIVEKLFFISISFKLWSYRNT